MEDGRQHYHISLAHADLFWGNPMTNQSPLMSHIRAVAAMCGLDVALTTVNMSYKVLTVYPGMHGGPDWKRWEACWREIQEILNEEPEWEHMH